MKTVFPVGYCAFHPNNAINFQMNRWYSSGCIGKEALAKAAGEIGGFEDWTRSFRALAEEAGRRDEPVAKATYLRAAQFFALGDGQGEGGVPLKLSLYEECMAAYEDAYRGTGLEYERIPFGTGYLPVLYKRQAGAAKGAVVICGGYDSFAYEFVPYLNYAWERGFDVYLYEGCGQGEVLNRCGIKMRPDWERCTAPVLDHFGLKDVTLVGVSLGGYLAARAAAYEPRVRRVVLYDVIYDFYDAIMSPRSPAYRRFTETLLRHEGCPLWPLLERKMNASLFTRWLFQQGRWVFGVDTLAQYLKTLKQYSAKGCSNLITQDVLLLAGTDDLYSSLYEPQRAALVNARSVEGRVFTRADQASHHCQIGNLPLALDYIFSWLERKA